LDEATRQTYGLLVQDKRTTTEEEEEEEEEEERGAGRGWVQQQKQRKKEKKKGQKTSTDKITSADLGWVRSWHKLESTEAGIDAKKQEAWENRGKKKREFFTKYTTCQSTSVERVSSFRKVDEMQAAVQSTSKLLPQNPILGRTLIEKKHIYIYIYMTKYND
jgi:hypothetical protein